MPIAPNHTGRLVAGRYHLEAIIGEGGFGRVYRAVDERLATNVAVKVIHPWWAQDPEWAERFAREARIAAQINHPGVVRVTDAARDPVVGAYVVAELVDGESVRALLQHKGSIAPDRAAQLVAEAAAALGAAHGRGVVHRDVKPENLLIDRDGHLRVCDFGIARLQSGLTTTSAAHTRAGTWEYMAPEQALGKAGPAADQYALGVTLFEILVGRRPFLGDIPIPDRRVPELPAVVPQYLCRVVSRALATDPADRFPDMRALADALRAGNGARRQTQLARDHAVPVTPLPTRRAPRAAPAPAPAGLPARPRGATVWERRVQRRRRAKRLGYGTFAIPVLGGLVIPVGDAATWATSSHTVFAVGVGLLTVGAGYVCAALYLYGEGSSAVGAVFGALVWTPVAAAVFFALLCVGYYVAHGTLSAP